MKFSSASIGNAAAVLAFHAIDDGFCNTPKPDIMMVEQMEFATLIKRGLAEGKRRIVIDISYPKEAVK